MTDKTPLHRITLNITGQQKVVLDGIRDTTGASVTEQIRKSIVLYDHVLRAIKRGAHVEVIEENGDTREVTILF